MPESRTSTARPKDSSGPMTLKEQLEMPVGKLIASVPKRILALASKIVSFKGAAVVTATVLVINGAIGEWTWMSMVTAVVLGRDFISIIKK